MKTKQAAGALVALALFTATVAPARAQYYATPEQIQANEQQVAIGYLLALMFTTTTIVVVASKHDYDTAKAQSLVDQAYEGRGEKLDLLSAATKRPVETVADKIVALDKTGRLDPKHPELMAQVLATELK